MLSISPTLSVASGNSRSDTLSLSVCSRAPRGQAFLGSEEPAQITASVTNLEKPGSSHPSISSNGLNEAQRLNDLNVLNKRAVATMSEMPDVTGEKMAAGTGHRFSLRVSFS